MDLVLALKVFAVASAVLVGGEIAGHIGASVPELDDRWTSYRAIAAAALQVVAINALVIAVVLICSPSG
jgi:hypothetical protein